MRRCIVPGLLRLPEELIIASGTAREDGELEDDELLYVPGYTTLPVGCEGFDKTVPEMQKVLWEEHWAVLKAFSSPERVRRAQDELRRLTPDIVREKSEAWRLEDWPHLQFDEQEMVREFFQRVALVTPYREQRRELQSRVSRVLSEYAASMKRRDVPGHPPKPNGSPEDDDVFGLRNVEITTVDGFQGRVSSHQIRLSGVGMKL